MKFLNFLDTISLYALAAVGALTLGFIVLLWFSGNTFKIYQLGRMVCIW